MIRTPKACSSLACAFVSPPSDTGLVGFWGEASRDLSPKAFLACPRSEHLFKSTHSLSRILGVAITMAVTAVTSEDHVPFLDEDRKFLRTLAQLAHLDPRIRVREDESDLIQDTLAKATQKYGTALADMNPKQRRALLRAIFNHALVDLIRK